MSKNLVYVNLSDSTAKSIRQVFSICYKESVKRSFGEANQNSEYNNLLLSLKWEHLPSAYDQGTTGLGQFMQGKRGLSLFSL